MNIKQGFTLIEQLVVVALLSILAVGGQAVYAKGVTKARDADRQITLVSVRDIITLEISESNAVFASQQEFAAVLQKYNYVMQPKDDLCYFIASIPASHSPLGHAEYIVATWGELTSTKDPKKPGILAIGSHQAVTNLTNVNITFGAEDNEDSLSASDFACSDSIKMLKVERAFLGDPIFNE